MFTCSRSTEYLAVSASCIFDLGSCAVETQDAYSDGDSPHKSIVSDDADELYGDSIDEDSQSVKPPIDTAPAPSTSGTLCIILLALSHLKLQIRVLSWCSVSCSVVLEISFDIQERRLTGVDGVINMKFLSYFYLSCLSGHFLIHARKDS